MDVDHVRWGWALWGAGRVDAEQFQQPGLDRAGSGDLGRAGRGGRYQLHAGQGGQDEPAGGLGGLPVVQSIEFGFRGEGAAGLAFGSGGSRVAAAGYGG